MYIYTSQSVRKFTRCTPTLSYVKLLHDTRVRVKHHLYEERETTNNELTSTFSRFVCVKFCTQLNHGKGEGIRRYFVISMNDITSKESRFLGNLTRN